MIALAVINDVPVRLNDVSPTRTNRAGSGQGGDGLGHTVVGLKIVARNPVAWLRRRLDGSVIRKRQHEVRGHWRTYRDRESGEVKRKVWIAEHNRGDPSLGVVEHEYRLTGRRPDMDDRE